MKTAKWIVCKCSNFVQYTFAYFILMLYHRKVLFYSVIETELFNFHNQTSVAIFNYTSVLTIKYSIEKGH